MPLIGRAESMVAGSVKLSIAELSRIRALIVPERTGIGEDRAAHADILGNEDRELHSARGRPVSGAAKRILVSGAMSVARTDAFWRKAANQRRAQEECRASADPSPPQPVMWPPCRREQRDEVGIRRCSNSACRPWCGGSSTSPPTPAKSCLQFGEQTARRVPVVVERVVGQRVARRARSSRALSVALLERERRFAIGKAVTTRASG